MKIMRFAAGEKVPDYILDIEPITPAGRRPSITFTGETEVIDTGERFIVLGKPGSNVGPILVLGDGSRSELRIFAASKDVAIPLSWQTIAFSPDGDGDIEVDLKPLLSPVA